MSAFVCHSMNTCFVISFRHLIQLNVRYLSFNTIKTRIIDMPKDNSILINKLRENRLNNAKKTSNQTLVSNVFQLSILGNGSKGNPRSLYVLTERNSYLFNCGEGTQRLANEHKLKLSKLKNIFLTKGCNENMGGIVGLALTCQDIGLPGLTLHGPQHMDLVLSLYESFLKFNGLEIQTKSYIDYKYEDTDLEVQCFPILESLPNEDNIKPMKKLKTETNTGIDSTEMSFLYLCRLKNRAGELLIQRCIDLKVPPGPLLGKLKSGEDVVLSDKREIRSQDVMGPEEKGPIFMVVECPSLRYIDSLVTNDNILKDLSNEDLKLISVVVHFSPSDVLNDQRYEQWMKRLGEGVDHLVVNEDNPTASNVAANRLQIKLNFIDSFVFPLLHCIESQESKQISNPKTNSIINTNTLCKYHLRPSAIKGLDLESVANIDINGFKEEAISNTSFMESLNRFHSLQSQIETKTEEYPEIIFLGTGSAVPSKVRNTSAIWVNIDSETSFLLDCGEGTYGQLYRFYGKECETRLKQLKAIYVSHLHADHHLGILQIIKNRSRLTSQPLILIIPPAVKTWLQRYNQLVENISHLYSMVSCHQFVKESDEKVLKCLRLKELKTVFVRHCSHSYGIAFTTQSEPNFKIVYSGDTQPTPNLTAIGYNCHLLIHEASMEDELVEEARLKFHSTTSEAIEMGTHMNAKFTILTHFSQRYAKIPVFNESFNDKVGIAFDNMRVRMTDLNKLSKMIPTLKCLFEEQIQEMKVKTNRNLKRKELLAEYYSNQTK